MERNEEKRLDLEFETIRDELEIVENVESNPMTETEISKLKRELEQKEQELAVLHQISQTIGSTLDLEKVLKQIVSLAVKVTDSNACFIYLFDRKNNELILRAAKKPQAKTVGEIKLKVGEGITGWVAREKKPVAISKDAANDSRFKLFQSLPEDKYQAFLSAPIVHLDKVIGVINVQHKKPHKHSKGEIALLQTVAQQVGGAIENARLFAEAEKKARQIETLAKVSKTIVSSRYLEEILHLIVTTTAEMMNSKICSIMLLDEKRNELVIKATQSLSEEYRNKPPLPVARSVSGRAVRAKRPVVVLDVAKEKEYAYPDLAEKEGVRSLLTVPMMVKDRVIGVVNIYTSTGHFFTEEEIKILSAIANQAAVTIENTRLMEESLAAKEALETRKAIERAKGILMKQRALSEEEAFRLIQKHSMDNRKSMKEVAEAIILAAGISK